MPDVNNDGYLDIEDDDEVSLITDPTGIHLLVTNADNSTFNKILIDNLPNEIDDGTSLPASPVQGDVFLLLQDSGSNSSGMYICLTAGTWSAVVGASGTGIKYTIGPSFPASPSNGDIHQLDADATLQAEVGKKTLTGETNAPGFAGSRSGKVAYINWQNVGNGFFFGITAEEAAPYLNLGNGSQIYIGNNVTLNLTGTPTYNSTHGVLIINNTIYSDTIQGNPITDGSSYVVGGYPSSSGLAFNKWDRFKYNGSRWEFALAAFKVNDVPDGTLARDDKVLAVDQSDTVKSNIKGTIASLLGLIKASDIRSDFESDKTANYTVVAADEGKIIPVNTSSGNITVTLPDLGTGDEGFSVTVLKSASNNTLTIDGNGSDTINGAANTTLTEHYQAVILGWNGTAWIILADVNKPGYGNNYTVGTSLPSNPKTGDIHQLSANANITAYVSKGNRTATRSQSTYTSGSNRVFYGTINGQTGFWIKSPGDLSNLTHLVSGDTIRMVPSSGTTLTLTLTGSNPVTFVTTFGFSNVFIASSKFTQSYNTNSLIEGTVYAIEGGPSSYEKEDEFRYDGSVWILVFDADQVSGFKVYNVSSGTLARSDEIAASDDSDSNKPNIKGTIASLLELAIPGDVRAGVSEHATDYTITAADEGKLIICNVGGASRTYTLPSVATVATGWKVTILRENSNNNTLTIATNGSQQINNQDSYVLTEDMQAVTVVSDGGEWYIESEINEAEGVSGVSYVEWLRGAAFVDGDLDSDTGTYNFTKHANAPSDVADGSGTTASIPKNPPGNTTGVRVQLKSASNAVIDTLDIAWGDTSSVLSRRLEVDSDTYVSFTFDLVNGTTPTFKFGAENSDNGLTGHYVVIYAIVMAPNQSYTPVIPKTPNGVHRRCIAELTGTTGSTAPGLSLITAAYTPQNANARIFVRLRIAASCVGNSDNDYSQIACRVKRGSNNYKRIDEQADGYSAIAGERMWQYSDNTARVHYEEFELEPENNTDEIKVNLSLFMKDAASVSSTTGRLNRWGTNRNLGPSYIEIYELIENGTIERTTITSLDAS